MRVSSAFLHPEEVKGVLARFLGYLHNDAENCPYVSENNCPKMRLIKRLQS